MTRSHRHRVALTEALILLGWGSLEASSLYHLRGRAARAELSLLGLRSLRCLGQDSGWREEGLNT